MNYIFLTEKKSKTRIHYCAILRLALVGPTYEIGWFSDEEIEEYKKRKDWFKLYTIGQWKIKKINQKKQP